MIATSRSFSDSLDAVRRGANQGLDLGAVDYLRKPIDDRVLINKINGFRQLVVRERQEQQSLEQTVQKTSRRLGEG